MFIIVVIHSRCRMHLTIATRAGIQTCHICRCWRDTDTPLWRVMIHQLKYSSILASNLPTLEESRGRIQDFQIEGAQRACKARSPLRPGPGVQGPLKGLGSWGFRCSLMLSEPYREAFWYKIDLKSTVDQNLEGARNCCAPPGSATGVWKWLYKGWNFSWTMLFDRYCMKTNWVINDILLRQYHLRRQWVGVRAIVWGLGSG